MSCLNRKCSSRDKRCIKNEPRFSTKLCPIGWHYMDSTKNCYFVTKLVSYKQAQEACAKHLCRLAVIPNDEVKGFIIDIATKTQVQNENHLLDTKGIWVERIVNFDRITNVSDWLDGSKFHYANFSNRNVSLPIPNGKCTYVNISANSWELADCDFIKDYGVCEKQMFSSDFIEEPCPLGWHYFAKTNSCYRVSLTWLNSKKRFSRNSDGKVEILKGGPI
jgi:hypothetical protein